MAHLVTRLPRRFAPAALAAVLLGAFAAPSFANPRAPNEYEVKAAYLYNFAKFVEWPPEAAGKEAGRFVIGILGDDPFRPGLAALLAGKTVQGRSIVVRRLHTIDEAQRCEVVFIGRADDGQTRRLVNELSGVPVLTVGEAPGFLRQGGMVGFETDNHKIRFSVNLRAAEAAHLKISSQLLKVAKTVRGAPTLTP